MGIHPEHFAGFLTRMGHNVRVVDDLWWFDMSKGIYTSLNIGVDIDAANYPVQSVLGLDGFAARFLCQTDQGVPSYRIVCDDPEYDLPSLRGRTRTQVRRGLEACSIEQVGFDLLRQQAIPLNADTLLRQGRRIPANLESYWKQYYDAAEKTAGAEAWGAFVDGQLAAYLIAFTIGDATNLNIVRSSLEHLKKFPNNALIFQYLHHTMRRGDIKQVVYGYESIQPGMESLDQFKTGMGFRLAPVGQRIELTRWMKPALNRFTARPASALAKRLMGNGETAAKIQGMLAWYARQPVLKPGEPSDPDSTATAGSAIDQSLQLPNAA